MFARFKTINIIDLEKNINNEILIKAYQNYLPDYLPTDKHKKHMTSDEYKQAGFWDFKRKEYYVDHEFSVDRYIKLINTYTEYLVLDEGLRKQFESYISTELTNKNVVITQKCSLFLARK